MAEQFANAIKGRCGIVSTSTAGSIGIKTNLITGISTVDVAVGDLVDTENFLCGSKVTVIGVNSTTVDSDSTNTAAATNQTVKYLGVTTAYKSDGTKSILIGGSFAFSLAVLISAAASNAILPASKRSVMVVSFSR